MEDSVGLAEIVTWALSIAALIVAVISFSRQHDIQKRLAAIEEERRKEEIASRLEADVTAAFERRPLRTGAHLPFLVLLNLGPASASDVTSSF